MSTSTHAAISPDSGTHWTEPGAWPAAPGVLRIPLPLPMDGLRAVNVYVLEADDGLTLIDGGWAIEGGRELLEKSLTGAGHALRDIRRFLVTHVHRDHYTQAVALRRELGSEISLGIGDKPTLDAVRAGVAGGDPQARVLREAGATELARQWSDLSAENPLDESLWGYPDTWLENDHPIAVGARTLDAISTPGHTQGHYVFADAAAKVLFAGDHVLPTITPSIGLEPMVAPLPLGDFLASLTKVRALPDLGLLPAHGPVAPSSHTRIDELVDHHDVRLGLCLDAVGSGETAKDVAALLPWTRHEHKLADLDVFNAGLAILETRAHLELLVARGLLDRTRGDDDAVVYLRSAA